MNTYTKNAENLNAWSKRNSTDSMEGYPLGYLSVKELLEILGALPEDYRVSCCGADCYLYVIPGSKSVILDDASYLA